MALASYMKVVAMVMQCCQSLLHLAHKQSLVYLPCRRHGTYVLSLHSQIRHQKCLRHVGIEVVEKTISALSNSVTTDAATIGSMQLVRISRMEVALEKNTAHLAHASFTCDVCCRGRRRR